MNWLMWVVLCAAGLMTLVSVGSSVLILRLCKGVLDGQRPVMERQLNLIDKLTAIAAAKDLAAYQGIQVMDQQVVGYPGDTYDPSEAAAASREAEANGWDTEEMSDAQQQELRDLFA